MTPINKIAYPYLLIENSHLNFYNIEFDDESLSQFIDKMKKHTFICGMVNNILSSKEFTDHQKEMMSTCFPYLKLYNVSS
jgi:hypothetical protein